ncbi:hypothetical protein [Haloarcula argentinensis]|uniref:Uncharacterized protein n=1 Tax=Haloarcula argentinensis TaxID=43776 RepID=A0ABU2F637_HALAR|nr:hypothetical protein [Haloarcula argentinensis]EMA19014.1 hypothetical protein C443_17928 [Haloarcula argentinensis DSM 12282]MDS0256034.1 hypothetical protein [Haloarcula argentinensis]
MTEEVDFLIERIREEYGAGSLPAGMRPAGEDPPPLALIDRQDVEDEDDIEQRKSELRRGNIVSIASVDESSTPIGTEYDHDIERVAGIRIEGLTADKYGYVDESGDSGAPWSSLVRVIRRAILRVRSFPDTGTPSIDYTHLELTNAAPQSQTWSDYYRYDVDVLFDGFERLPDI